MEVGLFPTLSWWIQIQQKVTRKKVSHGIEQRCRDRGAGAVTNRSLLVLHRSAFPLKSAFASILKDPFPVMWCFTVLPLWFTRNSITLRIKVGFG
jgi:hypothetical protein